MFGCNKIKCNFDSLLEIIQKDYLPRAAIFVVEQMLFKLIVLIENFVLKVLWINSKYQVYLRSCIFYDFHYAFLYSGCSWNHLLFDQFSIWHWDIHCCYSRWRGLQVIKCFCLINCCDYFRSDSMLRKIVLYRHQSTCFHDTLNNCISIQWPYCS